MDGFVWFAFTFGLFAGLIFVIQATKFVSQGNAGIIERTGKYVKTVGPGVHFLMPIFSRLIRVCLKEQVDHYEPQTAITMDNMSLKVDAVLFFRIVDPKRAVYDVENYMLALETLTMTTLRDVLGSMSLGDSLKSRDEINRRLQLVLDERTGSWGVKVTGVEIKTIEPPKDFRIAMELEKRAEIERNAAIMRAQGQKQAAITEAEGAKIAAITNAEGEREALRTRAEGQRDAAKLQAQGKAEAYSSLFKAIKSANVDSQVIAIRYLEALEKVANGKASTLILPYDSAGVLGAIAQITQTMGVVRGNGGGDKHAAAVVEPTETKSSTPVDVIVEPD